MKSADDAEKARKKETKKEESKPAEQPAPKKTGPTQAELKAAKRAKDVRTSQRRDLTIAKRAELKDDPAAFKAWHEEMSSHHSDDN